MDLHSWSQMDCTHFSGFQSSSTYTHEPLYTYLLFVFTYIRTTITQNLWNMSSQSSGSCYISNRQMALDAIATQGLFYVNLCISLFQGYTQNIRVLSLSQN